MTNNNVAQTIALTGATKYRVGTRARLQAAGFTFAQVAGGVDEYRKGGVVARFTHGAKNTMTAAEIMDGKGPNTVINDGKLKLERAIAALLGESPAPWYMTDAELKTLPPLGKGDALIKGTADFEEQAKEDEPAAVVSPEAKAVPKPAPRRKAAAVKAG